LNVVTWQIDSLATPHAHEMIRQMKRDDREQICDCGLAAEKSSLPRGWSVHLSQDEETRGEV